MYRYDYYNHDDHNDYYNNNSNHNAFRQAINPVVSTNYFTGTLLVVVIGVSLVVFTGGLLLTRAVIYIKRCRRLSAHLAQPSARQSATLYELSTLRCMLLLREQTLSKEEQYQLTTSDCDSKTVRVDCLLRLRCVSRHDLCPPLIIRLRGKLV